MIYGLVPLMALIGYMIVVSRKDNE